MSYTSYSYTKTGYFAGMPIGSLVGFSSSTMPSGWIKCNGVAVSNTTGLYNNLINLGIGTGALSSGTYTPPNLTNCIMMGIGSGVTTAIGAVSGSDTANLGLSNMPAHTHVSTTITTAGHYHTYTDYASITDGLTGTAVNIINGIPLADLQVDYNSSNHGGGYRQDTLGTNNSNVPAHTHTVNYSYTSGNTVSSINVTNPGFTVIFILKYK